MTKTYPGHALLAITLFTLLVIAGCSTGGGEGEPEPSPATGTTETAGDAGDRGTEPTSPAAASPTTDRTPISTTATRRAEPTPTGTTASGSAPAAPTATASPEPVALDQLDIELAEVASGLQEPTGIAAACDGTGRLFVIEKEGRIQIVHDGTIQPQPFLNITDRVGSDGSEQGLLGLAFHPDYQDNGTFYVNYTDTNGDTMISRFQVTDDPARADPASETPILSLAQPASNHNGGHLTFGPDGYLYIGMGDGGGGGDTYGNAQNGNTLLGAMLRIQPSTGAGEMSEPYAIPPNNPFVDNPDVRDEIWAIGLRNPWRYSFDAATGDFYIGDVGQNRFEEVNFQAGDSGGGENYGWPILEGVECYESDSCQKEGYVLPVTTYPLEEDNCAVTGGYVYRGADFPELTGTYLFGDYCSGRIWALHGAGASRMILDSDLSISSFGQSESGEIYAVDLAGGGLYRITVP